MYHRFRLTIGSSQWWKCSGIDSRGAGALIHGLSNSLNCFKNCWRRVNRPTAMYTTDVNKIIWATD
ncbi:pathway-specific nitrogen regulator [Moniliophthora roreri]|nr:pathway-specific nitrogen regulator [Moniliophthora roreri]